MIKKIIKIILPNKIKKSLISYKKQIRNFKILALEYGQYRTIKYWQCIDKYGDTIPWFTYPAIEYLSHLYLSEYSVFEYGSGYSTLYWMNRVKEIVSVEHDKKWYEEIKLKINNKVIYLFIEEDSDKYVNVIINFDKKFDIYIIDGKWREECAKKVVEHINRYGGGMVIFDNSDWYPKTVEFLRNNLNWIEVDFHGFGPINNYTWTTSFFINPQHRFKYAKNLNSQGGIIQVAEDENI
jgi:hypothetical protein